MVDYYPLTIAEALSAGMTVLAMDSPAAREFIDNPDVVRFDDAEGLLEGTSTFREPRKEGTGLFAPDTMADNYIALYRELNGSR